MANDEKVSTIVAEKNVTIFVDGTKRIVSLDELSPDNEITYEQVLALSPQTIPSGPYIDIEVDFTNGAGRPPDGSLYKGDSVKIQDGTVFDVQVTDRS